MQGQAAFCLTIGSSREAIALTILLLAVAHALEGNQHPAKEWGRVHLGRNFRGHLTELLGVNFGLNSRHQKASSRNLPKRRTYTRSTQVETLSVLGCARLWASATLDQRHKQVCKLLWPERLGQLRNKIEVVRASDFLSHSQIKPIAATHQNQIAAVFAAGADSQQF